jgi:hypothetical protein
MKAYENAECREVRKASTSPCRPMPDGIFYMTETYPVGYGTCVLTQTAETCLASFIHAASDTSTRTRTDATVADHRAA